MNPISQGNGKAGNGNGGGWTWYDEFLGMVPQIRRHAYRRFRHLGREKREKALANVAAIALMRYLGLVGDGQHVGLAQARRLARSASLEVQGAMLTTSGESRASKGGARANLALVGGTDGQEGVRGLQHTDQLHDSALAHERAWRGRLQKLLRAGAHDLDMARHIQERLLPVRNPELPGFDIAGLTRPADATGGDYFDYVPMLNGCLGVVVADVCGHGIGPALITASTRAYLRAFAQTEPDLARLLALVDRVLKLDIEDDRFVTLMLARLEAHQRSLVYVSAGHPNGYVLDTAGRVRLCLASSGPPLGLAIGGDFVESPTIPLDVGEIVLLLTDGVVEATASCGTAFGWRRAVDIVRAYRADPAARIAANLFHAVRAFCQLAPQGDDITVVVIKARE